MNKLKEHGYCPNCHDYIDTLGFSSRCPHCHEPIKRILTEQEKEHHEHMLYE
jgi:Zn finger protein HypA/HybF involved in hydrogenase expression